MKLTGAIVATFFAICLAAPIRNIGYHSRDTDLEKETDRLLFTATMAEFQAARDAQDPPGREDLSWRLSMLTIHRT